MRPRIAKPRAFNSVVREWRSSALSSTSGGRTVAQGALAWLWARSPKTIPIPGFRTVPQVRENAGALAFGPLTGAQRAEIDQLLGRRHG